MRFTGPKGDERTKEAGGPGENNDRGTRGTGREDSGSIGGDF